MDYTCSLVDLHPCRGPDPADQIEPDRIKASRVQSDLVEILLPGLAAVRFFGTSIIATSLLLHVRRSAMGGGGGVAQMNVNAYPEQDHTADDGI